MNISQRLHDYRVFPRLVLVSYMALVWDVVQWFKHIDNPTTQQVVLLSTVVGLSTAIFGFYVTSTSGTDKR